MPDKERPHFEIPEAIVRTTGLTATGGSVSYKRGDYGAHGAFLLTRAQDYRRSSALTRDAALADALYLQIKTPRELPIKSEKQRFRQIGLNIVTVSSLEENIAIARISKTRFAELENRIDNYAHLTNHPNRSYLSAIEDLSPVASTEKLSPEIDLQSRESVDCLLFLYSDLSERERAAILLTLRNFLVERGQEVVDSYRFVNGVTTIQSRLTPSQMLEVGENFSTLRLITPNHVFYISDSTRLSPLPPNIEVTQPSSAVSVAVVDTGINQSCPLLQDLVLNGNPATASRSIGITEAATWNFCGESDSVWR